MLRDFVEQRSEQRLVGWQSLYHFAPEPVLRGIIGVAVTHLSLPGSSRGATIGLPSTQSKEPVVPVYNGVTITKNPAIFSGRPIINRHRVTVHDVVVHYRAGVPVAEIATAYSLAPDEVAAALAYYQEHKATIDRQIAAYEREIARRAAADSSPVAEQMRQITTTLKRRRAK